jgi:hypothetical protein
MAFTLNGIGTQFFGHRLLPEGKVVMTKWFIFLYAPLIPLGTFHILEWGNTVGSLPMQTTPYKVRRTRLDWYHIGLVYLLYVAFFGTIYALTWILGILKIAD